jgi:hypothetical protein
MEVPAEPKRRRIERLQIVRVGEWGVSQKNYKFFQGMQNQPPTPQALFQDRVLT